MHLESTVSYSKKLSENCSKTKPELVRYLPQNYFEHITNEIEIEAFQKEIEDVVFSHVEETSKMGKTTFFELQEFKTLQSTQQTNTLKSDLSELNAEIVKLEDENDPLFKNRLEESLKAKEAELKALDEKKPKEVEKPSGQTPEQIELSEKIKGLNLIADELNIKEKDTVDVVSKKKSDLQKLTSLQQSFISLNSEVTKQKRELDIICKDLGLNIDDIAKIEINTTTISIKIAAVKIDISNLEIDNKQIFSNITNFKILSSLPDLRAGFIYIQSEISKLKELLGTPERKYQTYLENLAKWNTQRLEIIGDEHEPKLGTIKNLKNQIVYIEKELSTKISKAYSQRREICENIFKSKEEILKFYSELKESVESKLKSVRTTDFSVNIEAAFILDPNFSETLLNFINKNKVGAFYGNQGARELLKDLISEINWNDFNSVYKFLLTLLDKLNNYNGKPNSIKDQINLVNDFYDYIFSLGYFSTKYELRLGGKSLIELSPGEKGLLLLVFYLQLDKNNTPLIIDQPEDNLDNESIFTVLASCIREAKKSRQVILVTHNPNLAVGADAEQIIYVQLDKSKNHKFNYETGAIENPRITQKIIDVLEGTQPAFIKRRLKYQI